MRMETPEAEARPKGYLDVEAEELDDLFSALSRTPEVKIRTLSTGPVGSTGGATPRHVQRESFPCHSPGTSPDVIFQA